METIVFYILAAVTLVGTVLAITARQGVHAIVYLVTSFFALALIFYLLGAPMVASFEVIIYAGAIMVLFLFVIMMLDLGKPEKIQTPKLYDWCPAILLLVVITGSMGVLASRAATPLNAFAGISVQEFSFTLFKRYGAAIEIISMQLLFALVGALYLGRRR
ncbi:NADH-quinone oxidoreductase subunit J family protein [Geomesophilobacter sediminis]|uniref:NADH-quinone oxidoreductase subunit J n=1 Tax=Geomesophilobacter sediminis TaxID=2798584 RepID=A0A8J7JM58_9BACT|nr:NADH-quinone oxidoreductase subunit J [Geomesophilobacter sediminis]MBJ6725685.1 NADH-quinone oxidoreductase subunit J [Geomesophilobacter sediminis]